MPDSAETNLFALTRQLVDIESISNAEARVGEFLFERLCALAGDTGGRVERMPIPGSETGDSRRFNVLAAWGEPVVTLSTHMDTVPPFFPSREDEDFVWGRGACDAKGIIAAMIAAAERLLSERATNFALLFVVGEERNSAGARAAAASPRGSKFLVNGEPTENKLAVASKGALRLEAIARGRLAHSAYPELGESAIEKLLDALDAIRRLPLPRDPVLGLSTLNIGTISGGQAPNVIADAARAEILVRLTGEAAPVREVLRNAVGDKAELHEILCVPVMRFEPLDGLPTTVVAYTTDIPMFAGAWGKPLLIGPGSIHVAHTAEERVAKRELIEAAEIYARTVRQLLCSAGLR